MPTNAEIAAVFDRIADLLDILGENEFRTRAYRTAAMTVRDYGPDLGAFIESGEPLPKLPGLGKDLAGKLVEIATTGTCKKAKELEVKVPAGLLDMLTLPGLGPKRVKMLWEHLGVHSMADLKKAAEDGRIKGLKGLGPKTEAKLLEALAERAGPRRHLLSEAAMEAEALVAHLKRVRGTKQAIAAGSYRRGKETVGDLDILATTARPEAVVEAFVTYPGAAETLAHGPTRAAIKLRSGLQVDLRVVPEESYGAALHYFTGSKAHNVAIRQRALRMGLKVNEYGVFEDEKRIAGETEASVFAAVGLPYIAPELRENNGEIEAAKQGRLPHLVETKDLRGDLHCHTTASDGKASLEDMVAAAQARGLTYLAVTEHTPHVSVTNGLDVRRLRARLAEIEALNAELDGFRVLKAAEVDILADGALDYPDEVLAELDVVVASVHSRFGETRAQQTARLLRAIDNRYITLLGHPTGRRLLERPPYEVDLERVVGAAKQRGCALELNSQPQRLDLDDTACRMAHEAGVLVAVNSDAHSVTALGNVRYGIAQARRAWLTKHDVLNTRSLHEVEAFCRQARG